MGLLSPSIYIYIYLFFLVEVGGGEWGVSQNLQSIHTVRDCSFG